MHTKDQRHTARTVRSQRGYVFGFCSASSSQFLFSLLFLAIILLKLKPKPLIGGKSSSGVA